MADYIHIHLKFSTNITWFVPDNKEWIIYASKRQGYFTVWQNMNKALPESHILQASASGNEARRLQAATGWLLKKNPFILSQNYTMLSHII